MTDLRAVSLPADFLVWITSEDAKFLKDKLVFASWDVDELKGLKGLQRALYSVGEISRSH